MIPDGVDISPRRAQPGDVVLVSGPIAEHGIAIMSVREGLEFETALESDSAPLHGLVRAILDAAASDVHVLRDPTRGGVASALNEIAAPAQRRHPPERSGDPGRRTRCAARARSWASTRSTSRTRASASPSSRREAADAALAAMLRADPLGREAAIIGEVVAEHPGKVTMRSRIGGTRIVDMLTGEQLPRIC